MCQSAADGGKRCAAHTPTGRAATRLSKRLDEQVRAKDTSAAFNTVQALGRLNQARAHYGDVVTPMDMELPASVHEVFAAITGAGYRPLVVGGSVRDALTDGRAPKDVDVEVYGATLDETITALRADGYKVDEVGKAFGVLKVVLPDGTDLDVSVPRRDNHTGAGHRGFTVETDTTMTAVEAASRRDFTINALGYDPEFGVCVDPYNGRADLKANRLRATSEAFAEDPLRVLRGFQFAARYGMDLDPDTAQVCRNLVDRAGELPVERVRGEWAKFYAKGTHPSHGLAVLSETGWDNTIPGLYYANTPQGRARVQSAADAADAAGWSGSDRARVMAAALAVDMNEREARAFVNHTLEGSDLQRAAYGLSRADFDVIAAVRRNDVDSQARDLAHSLGTSGVTVEQWVVFEKARGSNHHAPADAVLAAARRLGCAEGPQPDLLKGRDIIARWPEEKPGKWTGDWQRMARQAQVDGVFTTRDGALAWLQECEFPD